VEGKTVSSIFNALITRCGAIRSFLVRCYSWTKEKILCFNLACVSFNWCIPSNFQYSTPGY